MSQHADNRPCLSGRRCPSLHYVSIPAGRSDSKTVSERGRVAAKAEATAAEKEVTEVPRVATGTKEAPMVVAGEVVMVKASARRSGHQRGSAHAKGLEEPRSQKHP